MDTWYERMTTLDSLFLELEDRSAHMHVGAVGVFEGPPPPYRDLLALIEARLDQVPRYRQRVMFVPLKQGRPVWIDETQFDLEYHVRHTALPAPGGEEELKKLVARLFSQALDREKPLWELWLVEGLGDSRFAIVSKTHHCMLDGVSGVDLATVLMDREPRSEPPPAPPSWKPRAAPRVSELLVESVKQQFSHPLRMARQALEPNSEAVKLFTEIFSGLKPFVDVVSMGRAPQSPLNVPIGPHRRFEMVDLPLPKLKQVRSAKGGTVNDIVLATVAGALRSWLLGAGLDAGCRPARAGAGEHALAQGARHLRQPGLRGLLPAPGDRAGSRRAPAQGPRGDDGSEEERVGGGRARALPAGRFRPAAAPRAGRAAASGDADVQPRGHERARPAVSLVPAGKADDGLLPARCRSLRSRRSGSPCSATTGRSERG